MKNKSLFNYILMSLMLVLLIISGKIIIPYMIPFTLQSLAICVITLILGPKKSFLVILLYILLGLIGIPIFTSGGGFSYVFMPTFGYLIGFLFYSLFVGNMAKLKNSIFYLILINIIGELIVYFFGATYMYLMYNINNNHHTINYIIGITIIPFIVFDFIKIIMGCFIYKRIYSLIPYKRMEEKWMK